VRIIRCRKETPWILALWLFAQGFACGLWLSFRKSEEQFRNNLQSLEESITRER
jgi:hypothetical protein